MNSPDETKTQPEKEFAIGFAKQIGDLGALVTRILAAVFFTILLLTGNTMAQSIRERIPELAILKTIGFSDGKVTALVLAEALLLLFLGGWTGHGGGARAAARPERRHRRALSAALRERGHLAPGRRDRRGAGPGHRAAAGAARAAAAGSSTPWRAMRGDRMRVAQPGRPDHLDQPADHPPAARHLAGRGRRHRRGGRRAGVGAGDVGGLPPHPGQHRAARPRDHAARGLRRRAVQRRGARAGHAARQPARGGARRRRPPPRLGRAGGDGGSAAQGRDPPQQRALPRRAAGRLRHSRRAEDRGGTPLQARRARGDRGPEGGAAVRRAERGLVDRLPGQRLDGGRDLRERGRRARVGDLGGRRGRHVGVSPPGLSVGHGHPRGRLGGGPGRPQGHDQPRSAPLDQRAARARVLRPAGQGARRT